MKNLVKIFFTIFCMMSLMWPPHCSAKEKAKGVELDASVEVTLSSDDKGQPVFKASCPKIGMNKWDYKLIKAGYILKSQKKGQFLHTWYEKGE